LFERVGFANPPSLLKIFKTTPRKGRRLFCILKLLNLGSIIYSITKPWEPRKWRRIPMVHSKPFSVQPDRTTGKSERGIHDNVKPVGKPEPLVHENLASTQELAKQALDAVQSSTLSDDSKDAYAALADALGTRNQDFVQGPFGQLLEANARGGQKF
jgi:hypothetical protein